MWFGVNVSLCVHLFENNKVRDQRKGGTSAKHTLATRTAWIDVTLDVRLECSQISRYRGDLPTNLHFMNYVHYAVRPTAAKNKP